MRDVVIIGAGAAGLMSGIFAGRQGADVLLLDSAKKIGAKILVAGGGRCNVTHDVVDATAYAGSSRNAIKKVLKRFDVQTTIAFFEELGVTLKREQTGKLFPVTNKARTVLDALLNGVAAAGASIQRESRVEAIIPLETGGFDVSGPWGSVQAQRVIMATGGKSLPKSGSDGHGHAIAKSFGHSITRRVFPALVPLTLPRDHFICDLSGIAVPATLSVYAGKKGTSFTHATLCTHFGLSGPGPMDISRYYQAAQFEYETATLHINWLPEFTPERFDSTIRQLQNRSIANWLTGLLPERLAHALCNEAGIEGTQLTRVQRRTLTRLVTDYPLPITGNRGYNYAEVTAGGVPLKEIHLDRMESRVCDSLYLCGEICDVDGRIGGYNFQWAWSSGYIAGINAATFS